jgi:RNA polymerase sigma-70 factor (ECF subfamily)
MDDWGRDSFARPLQVFQGFRLSLHPWKQMPFAFFASAAGVDIVFTFRERMSDPDKTLVLRARAGDRSAFEELVRRTSRLLFARFYLETGCPNHTEDLIQETFLLAFRSLHQLADPAGFRGWLLATARNVRIDEVRKSTRIKRLAPVTADVSLGELPSGEPPPDEIASRDELRQQVLEIVRALPEEYRLPITLRYIVGVDCEAISVHLGTTKSAVRSMLYRGLKVLRNRLPADLRAGFEG